MRRNHTYSQLISHCLHKSLHWKIKSLYYHEFYLTRFCHLEKADKHQIVLRTRSSFLTLFTLNLTGDCGAVWALTGAWHHRIHTSLMSSHESSPLVSCWTLERGSWEGGGGLHATVMRHPSFLMSSYPCRRHSSDNCLQLMGARKICRSDLILAQERSSGDVRSEQRAATRFFSNSQNIFILFVFICFYFHESINTWA